MHDSPRHRRGGRGRQEPVPLSLSCAAAPICVFPKINSGRSPPPAIEATSLSLSVPSTPSWRSDFNPGAGEREREGQFRQRDQTMFLRFPASGSGLVPSVPIIKELDQKSLGGRGRKREGGGGEGQSDIPSVTLNLRIFDSGGGGNGGEKSEIP